MLNLFLFLPGITGKLILKLYTSTRTKNSSSTPVSFQRFEVWSITSNAETNMAFCTWKGCPGRDPFAKGDSYWKSSVLGWSNAVCVRRQGVVVISAIYQWNNTPLIERLWTTVNQILIHHWSHQDGSWNFKYSLHQVAHAFFASPQKTPTQNLKGSWDWRHKSCKTWRLASYEWLWHLCPLVSLRFGRKHLGISAKVSSSSDFLSSSCLKMPFIQKG